MKLEYVDQEAYVDGIILVRYGELHLAWSSNYAKPCLMIGKWMNLDRKPKPPRTLGWLGEGWRKPSYVPDSRPTKILSGYILTRHTKPTVMESVEHYWKALTVSNPWDDWTGAFEGLEGPHVIDPKKTLVIT
jgi:hypothetical protein